MNGLTAAPERAARHKSKGNVFLYVLAFFLPPVPVFLKAGCGCDVLVNIIVSFSVVVS